MRCEIHCPPAADWLRGPLKALGAVAALAVVVYVISAAASGIEAAALSIMAVNAVMAVAAYRLVRYGRSMRPAKNRRASTHLAASRVPVSRTALPAPPLAIEGPRAVPGEVLRAAEGEKVAR